MNVLPVEWTDAGRLFATPEMPAPGRVENASNAAWPARGLLPAALPLTAIVDSGAPHWRFDGTGIPALLFPFMYALPAPAFVQDARMIAEQITRKWEHAVNAGDAAALTALYTKDAALLPHGIPTPQIGEISIRRYFDDFVKITRRNLSLLVTESKMLSPDGVFMVGTWSADVAGKNGGAGTHVCGTYSSIFVREGSDWRCRADNWNEISRPEK